VPARRGAGARVIVRGVFAFSSRKDHLLTVKQWGWAAPCSGPRRSAPHRSGATTVQLACRRTWVPRPLATAKAMAPASPTHHGWGRNCFGVEFFPLRPTAARGGGVLGLSPRPTRHSAWSPSGAEPQRVRPAPAGCCWGLPIPANPHPAARPPAGSSWPTGNLATSPMRALLRPWPKPDTPGCCLVRQNAEARAQRRNGRGGWPVAKIWPKQRAQPTGRQQGNVVRR